MLTWASVVRCLVSRPTRRVRGPHDCCRCFTLGHWRSTLAQLSPLQLLCGPHPDPRPAPVQGGRGGQLVHSPLRVPREPGRHQALETRSDRTTHRSQERFAQCPTHHCPRHAELALERVEFSVELVSLTHIAGVSNVMPDDQSRLHAPTPHTIPKELLGVERSIVPERRRVWWRVLGGGRLCGADGTVRLRLPAL